MRDIMELLKSGKSVLYSLTIPEGLTVEQAFQRIAEHEALTGDMPATMPPEGSLTADTQRFTRGATRQQIIDKMLADQKKLVEDIWRAAVPDLPLADDQRVRHAGLDRREGDRRAPTSARASRRSSSTG